MAKPEILAFDLGRVLVDFDYKITANNIEKYCKYPAEELLKLLINSPYFTRYESGLISTTEFFSKIKELTGFSGTFDEFAEAMTAVFTPVEPMIEMHREIKRRGYRTFILSNTNELVVDAFRKRFPFFNEFDGYIFSYEQKALKPDEKIYRALEKLSGCCADQIVYIDDILENVLTARRLGWIAIEYKDPSSTRVALRKIGVLNNG